MFVLIFVLCIFVVLYNFVYICTVYIFVLYEIEIFVFYWHDVVRYLVHLEVQGDPAWECLVNMQKWLLKLMHRCQSEHIDKGQSFTPIYFTCYVCSCLIFTSRTYKGEAYTIPTDSVPTDAIPTICSQDDRVHL